jgi:hypothetical protein
VSRSMPNPAALKITNATVLSYEPPTDQKPKGVMTVRLQGTGFSLRLNPPDVDGAVLDRWKVISSGRELIITLISPEPFVVLTLTDTLTGGTDRTVIQRPATP